MSTLRLDYFLSLGLKLVEGDVRDGEFKSHDHLKQGFDYSECKSIIDSFAPRKNTGEQPCDRDITVEVSFADNDKRTHTANHWIWSISDSKHDVVTWKPDLQELIKMQDKHDNKQDTKTVDPRISNMAEVKPRMKVEYVKVDKNAEGGAFWECAKYFVDNNLFYRNHSGEGYPIVSNCHELLQKYEASNLYRKVETEITWQNELDTFLGKNSALYSIECPSKHIHLDVEITPERFVEMCRLVSSMNK